MQCHGNLNSSKMSHLPRQTLSLEDIAVDTFVHSSFGTVVMTLFQGFFTAPSWHTCPLLARGGALATERHTITTYVWLTGATTVKPFSRCSIFLGCPLSQHRWPLWGAGIRLAAQGLSPRARSCGSAATIRPRKQLATIAKGSPATVMAPAPPGKHTGHGAA